MAEVTPLLGSQETLGPNDERVGAKSGDARPFEARPKASTIGRFVVLRRLGMGAMGVVYAAYDEQLDRKVAVKLLKPQLKAAARLRVEREARALAKLTDPHVVHVYEVGEDGGQLYIAMEYVDGTTLEAWQEQPSRSWPEVLEAYRQAGEGLAAAHAAGLIHRDFKPANVMVSPVVNGKVRVRVLDFGLARVAEAEPSHDEAGISGAEEDVRLTAEGAVVGTPAYMAPEQFARADVEVAADQFSFCVALWEGLHGTRPYAGDTLPELVTAVIQGRRQAPPQDAGVPTWVQRVLDRGLAPRPEDRWPSMRMLLDALVHDPAKRRRAWVLTAAGVAVLGLGVGVPALVLDRSRRCSGAAQQLAEVWSEARREAVKTAMLGTDAPYAPRVWERTRKQLDAYGDDWMTMHTEACEATAVRHEQSEAVMDLRMRCLQRAKVELKAMVGVLATADGEVVAKAHDIVGALPSLARCSDIEALQAEVKPPAPEEAEAVELARSRLAEARAEMEAGRFDEAQARVDAAHEALRGATYEPVQAELAYREGRVLEKRGEYGASVASLERALELGGRSNQWRLVGDALRTLMFVVGHQRAKPEEGLRYLPLARALSRDAEAEAATHTLLAGVLSTQGKHEDAEKEHRRALALWETTLGPEHPEVARARNNLAIALRAQGKYAEAEAEHRRAVALQETALGPEHPVVAQSRGNLATALRVQGEHAKAEAEHRRALALQETALGPEHPAVAASRSNLGSALHAQGKHKEAQVEFRRALRLWETTLGPEHPHVARLHHNLAIILHAQGESEEAEKEFRLAVAQLETTLGPDHPDVAESRSGLADLLLVRGKAEEALLLAEQAWEVREARGDEPPAKRADTAFVLARALWTTRDDGATRQRARALAEQAAKDYRAAGSLHSDSIDAIEAWLAERRGR